MLPSSTAYDELKLNKFDIMNDNFNLNRLLAWLDGDIDEAGRKYVQFQKELIVYIEKFGGFTVAEELTDEVFNRVDNQLASPLLNEHFNSSEIADVPNLCRRLVDEAANNSACPGARIWKFLLPEEKKVVAEIAKTGKFQRAQRSILSKTLNRFLKRRDFYNAEDFNSPAFLAELEKHPLKEKIKADLSRELTQNEIDQLNRRLLEIAFPQMIKRNLADTPDAEKLPRCKRYARNILLEYQRNAPPMEEGKPIHITDERDNRLKCYRDCEKKLSERDREIYQIYNTGKIINLPDEEPLSDEEIKFGRKQLAEKYGLSPNTIRSINHRCISFMTGCVERCLKRQENN